MNKSKHTSSMAADQLTSAGSFPVRTSGEEAYSYMLKKEEVKGQVFKRYVLTKNNITDAKYRCNM